MSAAPSIREFLEANPLGSRAVYAQCKQHGIDLDSPWTGPSTAFRAALFPALDLWQDRPYVKQEEIYSADGIRVVFTGQRFAAPELALYLELLDHAQWHPEGSEAAFFTDQVLANLGRAAEPDQREWLHDTLIRLRGGTLEIFSGTGSHGGGLINSGTLLKEYGLYSVRVNPLFAMFFMHGIWPRGEPGGQPRSTSSKGRRKSTKQDTGANKP